MTGKRCVATHYLQIDHIEPFALGGQHSEDNCRVLCQHHNNQRVPLELRVRQTSVTKKQQSSSSGVGG